MITYAMGDAKYDFSSFSAIARMLPILFVSHRQRLSSCDHLLRLFFFSGQAEEDFFEAHPAWPQLEEPEVLRNNRAGEIAAHIAPALAAHFICGRAVAARG